MWGLNTLGFSGLLFLEGPSFRSPGRLKEYALIAWVFCDCADEKPNTALLPADRRLLTNVRLPREVICCSAANRLPYVTYRAGGPIPVAFARVVVDIFGAIDIALLQDTRRIEQGLSLHFVGFQIAVWTLPPRQPFLEDWDNASASTITVKSGNYFHYPLQCGQPPMWPKTAPTKCSTNARITAALRCLKSGFPIVLVFSDCACLLCAAKGSAIAISSKRHSACRLRNGRAFQNKARCVVC
jgi:hypothetical protein